MDDSNDILQQVLGAISEISKDIQEKLHKVKEREDQIEVDFTTFKNTSETLIKELRANVDNGLESIKTGMEKSLTANIAVIQNSISETKAGIKNDLSKQLLQLSENIQNIEQKSAQKYEEIISLVEKNNTELTASTQKNISECQGQITQLKMLTDSNEKSTNENITKFKETFLEKLDFETTQLKQISSNNIKELHEQLENIKITVNDITTNVGSRFDNFHEKIIGIQDDITKKFTQTDVQLESSRKELDSVVSSTKQELDTKVSDLTGNLTNKIQTIEENWSNKFTDVNEHFSKLFSIGENHSNVILNMTDLINGLRESYLKNFNELKDDQKNIMTSFQKIITGLGENIRNEVIILSKDVRNQLDTFAKDSSTLFMLKSDGDRIDDQQKTLDKELRLKTETIRQELIHSFDDSLKNFDSAIKDSINSVNEVKIELEKYKDEIESMIERKVNEKYEFVFEVLSSVLMRAETLTSLVREARIVSPTKVEVPIKELTSSVSVTNPQVENK